MGLFSSKFKTTVGTTAARVIEDATLPDSVKHGAVKGMFDDSGQFVENILEELTNSIGVKADRMYNYGKNKYAYGLPKSNLLVSTSGKTVVRDQIAQIVGQSVTLDYYHLGALNNLHWGWTKLVADHGYNPNTNVLGDLSTAKGKPVKLTNIVVVVTEASLQELGDGSLDQWGPSPAAGSQVTGNLEFDILLRGVNLEKEKELFQLDATAPNDYLRVEYVWAEDVPVVVEGVSITRTQMTRDSFNIQLTGLDEVSDWHQAKYTRADGQIGYWMYKDDSGVYPQIDDLHNPEYDESGSYFPFGYFRFNATSGNANKNLDWYKQSKKLMDYVGIDYEAVTDAIHQNPNITQVEQAMLMMSVPAVTTNQMEMRYLFDYFKQLLAVTDGDLQTNKPYQSSGSIIENIARKLDSSRLDASIVIQDARFKMALGFRHISRNVVQGSIGAIGTYSSGWGNETITETGTNVNGGAPVTWDTNVKSHWYRKQIRTHQYEEIRVHNLKVIYHIYGEYTATADEDDDILLIPLDRSITKHYSIPDRELLYARSMHYIFNSRVVTEIKWYQQGFFKALLIVAAIVMTIYTFGNTWQSIGAALAAGTITIQAVVYMFAIAILKYIAVTIAIRLFVKLVGVKLAFIVAIVAAIAGAYQAIEAGSMAGAPWASEMLQVATGLTKGINTELQRDFNDLKKESDSFQLFVKEEQKKLDEANKLLENSNWMTPLIIFGEKPNDYYNRTVHSGNIGVLSLDAISAYVDTSLKLPELTDTL